MPVHLRAGTLVQASPGRNTNGGGGGGGAGGIIAAVLATLAVAGGVALYVWRPWQGGARDESYEPVAMGDRRSSSN